MRIGPSSRRSSCRRWLGKVLGSATSASAIRRLARLCRCTTPVRGAQRDRGIRGLRDRHARHLRAQAGRGAADFLNRELSHRMKNLLAMVQAITVQTMRTPRTCQSSREVLVDRLITLGKAHDLLLGGAPSARHRAGDRATASAFRTTAPGRIATPARGRDRRQGGAVALHDGARTRDNAAKYGALSVPEGRVAVRWSSTRLRRALAVVSLGLSKGGPPVTAPARRASARA